LYVSVLGLKNQPPLFPVQGHLLIPDLSQQKHGFPGLFTKGQVQLVAAQGFFQGLSHLVLNPKEPVCRHHPINALVRTEVVVVGHEVPKPFFGFREVLWLYPTPELFPHSGPKPLRLSHGLRMVGACHHVLNAFTNQQLLEIPFSSPGKVLAALVRQHLFGFAEPFNSTQQGLGDDVLFLVQVQPPGNNVAAVIVQENRQINPFFAAV
jgi:hypothetical protein